jgi:hypothetical protein
MKKSELKSLLKPLIKECVKEAILDDGLLSGIILEVARGMGGVQIEQPMQPMPLPSKTDSMVERMQRNAFSSEQSTKLQEHKSKLMAAVGGEYNGVNLFEGTTPAPAQENSTQVASSMSGQGTSPGVDIASLFGSVGKNWNAHMGNLKEGK